MNQKGFATLEVILMVVVIGILATIAVPRFEKITTQTNTSKVLSDLATINTASAVYLMEKGAIPTYKQLKDGDYFENGAPQEPSGKVLLNGTATDMTGKSYGVDGNGKATFDGNTADKFTVKSTE